MRGAVSERKDWHGGGATSGGGGVGGEGDVRDRDGGAGARVPVPLKHVNRVADSHHFNADRIRIQLFHLRIQILLIIAVMRICDHWSTDPLGLYFEPSRLH
jgi:hypothetical protein